MNTKDMIRVSFFTSLTVIGGFLSLHIGPVPMTMQTVFVILSGVILGPKLASYSQIVYVLLGLIGLPVFAGGVGGLGSVLSPSFGFIIGFIPAANIIGQIMVLREYNKKNILIASLLGTISIFLIGIIYMHFILNIYMDNSFNFIEILNIGLIPFIPGEILKIILSTNIAIRINSLDRKTHSRYKLNQK